MNREAFTVIIDRYFNGTASDAERALIEAYLDELEKGPVKLRTASEERALEALLLGRIQAGMGGKRTKVFRIPVRRSRLIAAVVFFVLLGNAFYFFLNKPTRKPAAVVKAAKHDIAPGKDAAILTLSDGRQIVLDSTTGTITRVGGIQVINVKGILSYKGRHSGQKQDYNTITTARGNQYQLQLEDGTKVWLNSASSLRYPVAFNAKERIVQLKGEGYFEVAKDKLRPFHVQVNQTDVRVLGTHFNINAYPDEAVVKTTLLEGSVKVMQGSQEKLLAPGQQAQGEGARMKVVNDVDVDGVVAWKNGIFFLDNTDLPTLMRQISRWYDVDIQYAGGLTDKRFEGGISKKLPLSKVLESLEANGLHFVLLGKKLIVQP